MKAKTLLIIFLFVACVDRLKYDINRPTLSGGISIDGFISDQPGPYRININQTFDIESKNSPKVPVSAKQVIISDNNGASETLTEVNHGIYETNPLGIRGKAGSVYTLRVELFDGRIYESTPDTLLPTGSMDSVYSIFTSKPDREGATQYGFDILANSTKSPTTKRYMWAMRGTFKSDTHPDREIGGCYIQPTGICNFRDPCSGLKNLSTNFYQDIQRVKPCECCTCWYEFYNNRVILNDDLTSGSEKIKDLKIYHLPLNGWVFMYKIRVEVIMTGLSHHAFKFWKSVRDQQNANGNLFQPISGKIPNNFKQLNNDTSPAQGLFYAASVSSKVMYINRNDVKNSEMIPPVDDPRMGNFSCLKLFPNATTVKPSYWKD